MKQQSSRMLTCYLALFLQLLVAKPCMAGGVTVSYPDGTPAAGVSVSMLVDSRYEFALTTDDSGYFLFPTNDFSAAIVMVKAPNGKEFTPVTLPSAIIVSGDTALVLQPLL